MHESNLTAVQHFEKIIDPRCKVIVTAVLVSNEFEVKKKIKVFYKAILLGFFKRIASLSTNSLLSVSLHH